MPLRIPVDDAALVALFRRHGILKLSFFGSVLRDDFGPESDVDVLVDFEPEVRIGLFGFSAIQQELEEMLDRRVHLSTPDMLSKYFRSDVIRGAEPHYVAA